MKFNIFNIFNIINIFFLSYLSVVNSNNIVTVEILRPLFYETQTDIRTMLISIVSNPNDRLNINILQSDNSSTIFPNKIQFTRTSIITHPKEIAFIAGNSGDNKIALELYGIDSLDYITEFLIYINSL